MFSNSLFGTLVKPLDRTAIGRIVEGHGADRWRKRFKTWDHLLAMLAAQFAGADSLRELEALFAGREAHRYHLHCGPVKRSTLADANKSRDQRVFRDIAQLLMQGAGRKRREMMTLLTVLDASPIRLTGRGHGWALETQTRSYSAGLKLHVQFTPQEEALDYVDITGSNVNDITAAHRIPLEKNRLYVFDKGYCDYDWWHRIASAGSHFVTRLKRNAAYNLLEDRAVAATEGSLVLRDQLIELSNRSPRAGKINQLAGVPLRLVEIRHPAGKGRPFWIVSNALTASAEQIADWYKSRWSIELLFKWLKQNLKIKRFIGESRNAVMIQIYVAMIAYILLQAYKTLVAASHRSLRLKDVAFTIRTGLFSRPQTNEKLRRRRQKTYALQHNLWEQHTL